MFGYTKYRVSDTDDQKATAVIPADDFSNFVNIEGSCGGIYHYFFLSNGEMGIIQKYRFYSKNKVDSNNGYNNVNV